MKGLLLRSFVAFCIGTVITQLILIGYFLWRGTLNAETTTKVVALMNGIDITGDRLVQIMSKTDANEQPDFDEILAARKMASLDMDLRIRSQKTFDDELTKKLTQLQEAQQRFDQRREAFDRKLEEVKKGAQDEGLKEVQRTLQSLAADQAKDQLMKIYDTDRIDDVVNIIQGIPIDKRKEILAEFTTPDESEKLHEILQRIGDGLPTTQLIDEAQNGR
jgi:ACT domain-containing protein